MLRSVLTFLVALAAMGAVTSSTSARAQSPSPDSASSPSQVGDRPIHRQVIHKLVLGDRPIYRAVVHKMGFASEQPWRMAEIKLLAPGVGWALGGGRLSWTENGGVDWRNIMPRLTGDERIDGIFFLDRSRGWIAISLYEPDSDQLQLTLASTTDAGAHWSQVASTLRLTDYGLSQGEALGGGVGAFAFTDALHGWMYVEFGQSPNTWWSFLLVTSDAGRTWKRITGAPELSGTKMLLRTPNEVWLYGMDQDTSTRLYVTRDGARHWHEVAPKPAGLPESGVMGLPTFEGGRHGFLQVNGVSEKRLTMVLFETADGGRTWKPDRTVANLDDEAINQYRSSIVVGSEWIFAVSADHRPVLTKLGAGRRIDASSDTAESSPRFKDICGISFINPAQGWVIIGDGELLSTTDGGATWTDITSGPEREVVEPQGTSLPQ